MRTLDVFPSERSLDAQSFVETTEVASDTTADDNNVYFVDTSSGAHTITLPDPSVRNGDVIWVKDVNGGSNSITIGIGGSSGVTIDGNASITLDGTYESVTLGSNGDDWHVLARYDGGAL